MIKNNKLRKKSLLVILVTVFCMLLSACSNAGGLIETNKPGKIQSVPGISETAKSELKEQSTESSSASDVSKNGSKILIVYFSRVGISESFEGVDAVSSASLPNGNTITIAKMIAKATDGDLSQIITKKVYPASYDETTKLAADEQDAAERPALKSSIDNWDSYDTIFLGYPNWWGTLPMAVFAFLEEYDFSGKTIIPFCTHEGSRLGTSEKDIAKAAPKAVLRKGLAIRGSSVDGARGEVEGWLNDLGLKP